MGRGGRDRKHEAAKLAAKVDRNDVISSGSDLLDRNAAHDGQDRAQVCRDGCSSTLSEKSTKQREQTTSTGNIDFHQEGECLPSQRCPVAVNHGKSQTAAKRMKEHPTAAFSYSSQVINPSPCLTAWID